MNIKQKELILISYPFSDRTGRKVRPALVISNNEFNKRCQDCIAIPLTSVIKDEPYSLTISNEDLESGNLIKQSRARFDKLFAVNKNLVIKQIGNIKDETFSNIKIQLNEIF